MKQPEEYLGNPTDDADQGGDDEPLILYYKAARAVKMAQQDAFAKGVETAAAIVAQYNLGPGGRGTTWHVRIIKRVYSREDMIKLLDEAGIK